MKADALNCPRLMDHAAARRDPALEKVGAKLDALSPGSLGRAHAGDGIHAYLTDHREALSFLDRTLTDFERRGNVQRRIDVGR